MPSNRAWALAGSLGMVLVLLCTVTDVDVWLSARFYDPKRGWYLRQAVPWRWLYDYGRYPAIVLAVGSFLILLGSVWKTSLARYRRGCAVAVLAVALGPGLVVNGILKPYWGRPRPRHIESFGGTQAFRRWWQPGGAGAGAGRSFPSGHAAMGFVLVAGIALVAPSRSCVRWGVWIVALLYGSLMGWGRIVQGGHFLSDVVWAGGVSCGITMLVQNILPNEPSELPRTMA